MHRRLAVFGVGLVSLSVLFPATTNAVDVYTDPVGFITLNIQGTNGTTVGSAGALSYQGFGMSPLTKNRGVISSAVTNRIVAANQNWATGQFDGTNGEHYVEIVTGPNAGLTEDIQSTIAPDTIYTASDLSALIAAGEKFKIRKHRTIAEVFGPANEAGLKAGSSTTADQILVFNPVTQTYTTYYFSNQGFPIGTGWRRSGGGSTDASNVKLYYDQGFLVRRKTDSNLTLKLLGEVKLGPSVIPIEQLNNFAANVYPVSNLTLGASNLYTGDPNTGLAPGSSTTADTVLIFNPNTQTYATYYYSNQGFPIGSGWRQSGGGATDQSNVPLPMGGSVLVQRKAPRLPFNWIAPQTFTP